MLPGLSHVLLDPSYVLPTLPGVLPAIPRALPDHAFLCRKPFLVVEQRTLAVFGNTAELTCQRLQVAP